MRLHIGKLAAEELLGAVAGEVLNSVVKLAASVVTLARVTLGVLVGQPRSCRMHDLGRYMVLAGDELERGRLALGL